MTQNRTSTPAVVTDRFLLHLAARERRLVDPADLYFLEASKDDTLVRLASAKRVRDVRRLAEVTPLLARHGFVRIHDKYVVNLRRVRQLRLRQDGGDWELKLEPPVNRVLPISRSRIAAVWRALGVE